MFKMFDARKCHYIPFTQGAMVDNLDPQFKGSCAVLSTEWLLKKVSEADMNISPVYGKGETTNPLIPHPVVHGENTDWQDDELIASCFKEKMLTVKIAGTVIEDEDTPGVMLRSGV